MGIPSWASGLFRTAEEAHSLDRLYFEKLEEAEVEEEYENFAPELDEGIPEFMFDDIPCEAFQSEEAQGFESFTDCEGE